MAKSFCWISFGWHDLMGVSDFSTEFSYTFLVWQQANRFYFLYIFVYIFFCDCSALRRVAWCSWTKGEQFLRADDLRMSLLLLWRGVQERHRASRSAFEKEMAFRTRLLRIFDAIVSYDLQMCSICKKKAAVCTCILLQWIFFPVTSLLQSLTMILYPAILLLPIAWICCYFFTHSNPAQWRFPTTADKVILWPIR